MLRSTWPPARMTKLPLPASTGSSNCSTRLAPGATLPLSSAGVSDSSCGAETSLVVVVKFHAALPASPACGLPARSVKVPAGKLT
jgi:hypothetical protein